VSMCMYLTPKGFRGDRPGWFVCNLSCKEIPKHRINNCVRGGCPDYRERDDEIVAQAKLNWDGPASAVIPGAQGTLREWAFEAFQGGTPQKQIALKLNTTGDCVYQAIKRLRDRQEPSAKPVQKARKEPSGSCAGETQPAPTHELITCLNCRQQFPADSMHPDGDTLECDDCYREAHEPASEPTPTPTPTLAPTAARCQRCEAPVDGRLIMSGVGTVCEPCADAIRQEWEAEQYPAPEPEPEFTCGRVAVPIVADGVTRETALGSATIDACKAYLRYLGIGEAEVNVLPVFIAGYCARGAAA
jgi:hypothetical protein